MMKYFFNLKYMIIIIVIILCCTGCNGTITRDIRHAGFSVGDKFYCSRFMPKDKKDTSYGKIKYLTDSNIIDEDGKIYEVSLNKKFANNQNCKVADTDVRVKAIFDNMIIKGEDDKYYYLVAQNSVASYSEIPETDNYYFIYDLLLSGEDIVKVVTADSSAGLYYVLRDDGNIYAYTVSRADYKSLPTVSDVSIIFNKNDYDSEIIDFSYVGISLNTFIRTDNSLYRMMITNREKCQKYADVSCKYKLLKDEVFDNYKDYIITYNGKTLITTYGQSFQIS